MYEFFSLCLGYVSTHINKKKSGIIVALINLYGIILYRFVVTQILSGENREVIVETIHSKLMEVGEKVRNGEIPVELYHITKVGLE